jgi:hypothetical protein
MHQSACRHQHRRLQCLKPARCIKRMGHVVHQRLATNRSVPVAGDVLIHGEGDEGRILVATVGRVKRTRTRCCVVAPGPVASE